MTLLKRELDTLITQMHSAGIAYNEAVRQFKKRYILEVLAHHRGNQCKAAEELGMHRNTLSRTLAELDMSTAQIRQGIRRPPVSDRIGDRVPEHARIHNIANAR
jgi:Fis family transcriptional regulator